MTLKKTLLNKLNQARRIAVLGIGSELHSDDGAGIAVTKKIREYKRKKSKTILKPFFGFTSPENITGSIRKFKPTHLIIIDAVDMGKKPGTIRIIDTNTEKCASFSTHRIPLKIVQDYLRLSTGCETILIGIQPNNIAFGTGLTEQVQKSVNKVGQMICSACK